MVWAATRSLAPPGRGLRLAGMERLKTEEQEQKAMAEREANAEAARAGLPLPYPNPWDAIDPTKVGRDATDEEILESTREFRKLWRRPTRKRLLLP